VVGCRPESTADGIGLSEPVAAAVPEAADAVTRLLAELGAARAGSGGD
jgi:hydrogenase maturation protease